MWGRFLSSRWCVPVAALVGMLLIAPAMNMGLLGDDYLHWSLLTGRSVNAQPGSLFGLFTFADGNAAANQAMIDSGKLVWWANDHLRIAFWRPLAELSQQLDYQWWPDSPVLMHVHSLLMYGLMILLIGKLFRDLDADRQQAGLATWLFAGNMLHVFAVAWLASRNQMLSGLFMVLTLLGYHHWRQGKSAWYGCLAAACFVLGLFSAEASIQTAGYLLAYALFLEPGKSVGVRFKALLPFIVIALAWKALHSHLGYGSFGSPGYVDPASNASGFAVSLALRLPALMVAQWFGVSSVMFEQLSRSTQYLYSGAATLALLGLAWAVHALGGFRSALARFYAVGSILALAPACAGYPFDRLTINSDIGASGLLSIMLILAWRNRQQLMGWGLGSAKNVVLLVGFIHLIVFPIAKVGTSAFMKALGEAGEAQAPLAIPNAQADQAEHFLLINLPSAESIYYIPLIRQYHGLRNPATMHALGPNNQAMTLTRVEENALRLSVPTGFRGTITRDLQKQPFKVGDTVKMGNISVLVEEITEDRAPKTVVFRFPSSVQDAQWRFLAWKEDGVTQLQPPAIGQSVEIAGYDVGKSALNAMERAKK
ncbi:hypothetical protein [Aquabacterium sp. CECT 9606]|uniref:hypothetical protein n=1 Tax=Aquabacterium sp. CECT 9606 TaxID=2845822 RepID=UPI001E3C130C|nr:hypothetical protein [Aquabacterium sp. CECT 9606]CAH0354970.1 hypothetical protein AQB9606_04098 [Aquabacterium sp. CECT 9606]